MLAFTWPGQPHRDHIVDYDGGEELMHVSVRTYGGMA